MDLGPSIAVALALAFCPLRPTSSPAPAAGSARTRVAVAPASAWPGPAPGQLTRSCQALSEREVSLAGLGNVCMLPGLRRQLQCRPAAGRIDGLTDGQRRSPA